MGGIIVNINPDILRWAREESGFEVQEIAGKLGVSAARYANWEENGSGIPIGKPKSIGEQFKRQLAVFFLEQVPEKIRRPRDYRNLAGAKSKPSRKYLSVVRDVVHFRDTGLELMGRRYWQEQYEWLSQVKNINRRDIPEWLRAKLGVEIKDQIRWRSSSEAYRGWRDAVENRLGILIFQFPMSLKEVQGFCLTDAYPLVITVNSKHSYTARIFSIFHELAHILESHSGVCLWDSIAEQQNEELRCNSIAGKFLVPAEEVKGAADVDEIKAFASKLRISLEVYLRRMREEQEIEAGPFFELLEKIKASYVDARSPKVSVKIKPEIKSRASRGDTFYSIVLDAVSQDRISYTRASALLDLNIARVVSEA